MSNGAKVALAVGAGYLLGRTRKMRIALMLAGAGLTGKFPAHPSDLVAHGLKSVGTSNQVGALADQLRGEVLNAAKAAALAAATNRVQSLNDRVQGLASPAAAADTTDRASQPLRSVAGLGRGRSPDEEDGYDEDDVDAYDDEEPSEGDEDEYEDAEIVDEDEDEDEPEGDDEPDDEPDEQASPRTRRRAPRQGTAARSARKRSAKTESGNGGATAARTRRRASASTRRAPVRRGR
jgi:hypothetical protein